MIDGDALARAENILQVVYGQGMDRQLEVLGVDRDAWTSFLQQTTGVVKHRYPDLWASMDPRLEPTLNTIMTHCLLVGLVAGKDAERRIV